MANDELVILGARVNNLKNIDLVIPHNQLVVVTGLSGSGKSSLAFDTIYAEGQRRYMETMSSYARHFIGNLDRPDVDSVTGLCPVVAIEQKSTNKNPRSTVGTITEIYDLLRLLFAKISDAYSPSTGKLMVKYSENQIIELIQKEYDSKSILIVAPLIKGRKGHYRELFEKLRRQGFLKVMVDGEIKELTAGMQTNRYNTHDISLLIDSINVSTSSSMRLKESVQAAFKYGKDILTVVNSDDNSEKPFSKKLICPESGISYNEPEPNAFSFNSPYGACPRCSGLGYINEIDIDKIFPDRNKSIKDGGIAPLGNYKASWIFSQINAIAKGYNFSLSTPIKDIPEEAINMILWGGQEKFYVKNSYLGVNLDYDLNFAGIVNFIKEQSQVFDIQSTNKWVTSFMNETVCPECNGTRLKQSSLNFKICGKDIAEVSHLEFSKLSEWIKYVSDNISDKKKAIAKDILREIIKRIDFIIEVGLDYLSLDRSAPTLSGGEAQRIRLATQIGSQLIGVLYILDEPSIGLHQRDNYRLIDSLKSLRDLGNSIIVVEHDEATMRAADMIIDIGPGAGRLGGNIVAQGTISDILKSGSITGKYLSGELCIEQPVTLREGNGKFIELKGACGNNLKNIDLTIPLNKLICVTGVSGSGKSSLINQTLYPLLVNTLYNGKRNILPYSEITGIKNIDKVIAIDQSPIGKSSRSNPATYTNVFTDIRELFALTPQSKMRGYTSGRFSFNIKGGRCEECTGNGEQIIEMHFMPSVHIKCPKCQGKRYNRETLEIRYKGKSIADVLDMTINQAVEFFSNVPSIIRKISYMQEVGLGYLKLGQSATTLSGGEAQRIKLVAELSKRDTGNTLYILDEPTTGLHFEDIKVFLKVVNKLVDKGNTVIIIEHNIDVIKSADYIIDMGPEGGEKGGSIIAMGSPQQIKKSRKSYTAKYL
ncbi:MAG: excinuclease ABC subunit UvrA [Bacteroidales bacterium]|jgi:excinuclease ABC subunit A|nr:excinuclease ABC subunit UvrA [Bacteroidales bacterium]MDD3151584.1 excinuclease ABC subunit UvrA [Bacteroidales bacterium]MDD3914167.1 excinuclease ABC subunit UvrA [Bacteroidales bacterium]MDD4633702.1 excinuclease ABC subunit UvrA [Bacteroidales bacterium]